MSPNRQSMELQCGLIKDSDQCGQSEKKKIRDKALILVGFAGGFRRSELVSITRDDVEFVNEGVKIFVKKSKSDQSGEGMTKAIPSFKYVEYCPVDHLSQDPQQQLNLEYLGLHPHPDMGLYFSAAVLGYRVH